MNPSNQPQEFDQFAQNYDHILDESVRLSGESSAFFMGQKIALAARHCAQPGVTGRFLDFGCGVANARPFVRALLPGWTYEGVDVSEESLGVARSRHPDASFSVFQHGNLAFADQSFDLVMAAVVFHHIPHDQHPSVISEIFRVLKPGGSLIIFEHNPWSPATRHVVASCPFDKDAVLLSPPYARRLLKTARFTGVRSQFYLFFPRFLKLLRPLEHAMGWLPFGAQYFALGKRPPSS